MAAPETSDWQSIATMATGVAAFVAAITSAFIAGTMTRRSKVAEFRQEWINALRADIADFLAAAERYRVAYDGPDDGEREALIRGILDESWPIYHRIVLRMNPWPNANSEEDEKFLAAIRSVVDPKALPGRNDGFEGRIEAAVEQAQQLLKREWEVTKGGWFRRSIQWVRRRFWQRGEGTGGES